MICFCRYLLPYGLFYIPVIGFTMVVTFRFVGVVKKKQWKVIQTAGDTSSFWGIGFTLPGSCFFAPILKQ